MKFSDFQNKFRVDELKVFESEFWIISVRPAQPTLGALVISTKEPNASLARVGREEGAELFEVVQKVESALTKFCQHDKTNLLALMMVDPYVHFHFIPRYSGSRHFKGAGFVDKGWPGPPDLEAEVLSDSSLNAMALEIRDLIGK